jgi:hypothetical protein
MLNRGFVSLEWSLDNPPKPHAFTSLPVQAKPDPNEAFRRMMEILGADPAKDGSMFFGWCVNCRNDNKDSIN